MICDPVLATSLGGDPPIFNLSSETDYYSTKSKTANAFLN